MTSICIDGFNLALAKGSGIATYGRNLLQNAREIGLDTQVLFGVPGARKAQNVLNEAMLVDPERTPQKLNRKKKMERWKNTLLSPVGRSAFPIHPSGEVIWPSRAGGMPAADRFWAAQNLYFLANRAFHAYGRFTPVTFSSTAEATAPDIMHWTANLPLWAKGAANIYTFHDLIPLRLPHTTLDDTASYMKLSQGVADRADHIVVVSETTRQDVVRLLRVDERRVTNTYQAVSIPTSLVNRDQREVEMELTGIFNLGWKDYFLHFGAIEPKKNLGRIIEAYLASGSRSPLIIIGGRAWLDEGETALLAQVKRDGGENASRIRQYEYMPFSMLVSLIRGAKATLFPSLYEGFGLPVLESMALSTAVLTSTGGALPEIAGQAALIVDPYDVRAITRGIQALDADVALREDLEVRGRVRAEAFSPKAYQARLRELYTKLAS